MRTPRKNMLAITVDNTVDIVIITIDRQKYAPEKIQSFHRKPHILVARTIKSCQIK